MEYNTQEIFLDHIDEPQYAMRTEIPRDEVFELAADIKKNGLINPITVRPRGDRFEVVAGHRRFLAHRYGGIAKIRCIVRELNDDEAFAVMTSENLVREDVNPVDEAVHTKRLADMHNGDINKLKEILNRGEGWITSRLAVAEMSDRLKDGLRTGTIKLGVALALHEITDDIDQEAVLAMCISQGASVTMAQYYLAQWRAGLFGHALEQRLPDTTAQGGERRVVMLRDALDGKEYPADEIRTIFVHTGNLVYVEGLREHLSSQPAANGSSGGDIG